MGVMKPTVKLLPVIILLMMLFLGVTGCGDQEAEAEPTTTLVFADAGWESIRFHNYVAAFIIEEGLGGYETEVVAASTPATFTGLRQGDIDIYMEVWQENIQEEYRDAIETGDIEVLSVNFDDNAQGLYVPTYMIEGDTDRGIEPVAPGLKSVFDLPDYWELFEDPEDASKGRVYGAPPDWAIDEILEIKMETYGLYETFNYFRPGSDTALATSIVAAYDRGEPWVGYYWEPTWVMGMYDMTLLEEPEFDEVTYFEEGYGTEIPSMEVTIAVNSGLQDKAPDVVAFLENYSTSSELTSEALAYMQENEVDEREAARWFLQEFQDVWTGWVSEEVAERVLESI